LDLLTYLFLKNILPEGVVRDEATFFVMLLILAVLVVIAMILRKKRK
jgi:hypothetical protein